MKLKFYKYHGAGNDFIMIDNRTNDKRIWESLRAEVIRGLCARNFGIGADGIILAVKSGDESVPYSMSYFNADGTPAEMCGNGLRCLMRFLQDLGEPVAGLPEVGIMTGAGAVKCRFNEDGEIQVEMPPPSFDPHDTGIKMSKTIQISITVPGLKNQVTGTAVSIGNPHFVIYNTEMWEGDEIHDIGHRLEIHKDLFPEGVNVGFARKESPETVALIVWERGVGPTLACGSGAVAAVAAGIAEGKFDFDRRILVRMPGGNLFVTIGNEWSSAILAGDAVRVFEGEVEI